MAALHQKLLLVSLLVMLKVSFGERTSIPKPLKQLYKQFKRQNLYEEDGNINTVRYIQAIQGSVTSRSKLMFNLDSLHKQDESLIKAELHFYRRGIEAMKTIQMEVSEISPYYISSVQREQLSPAGKGWQRMNITAAVKRCINTISSYNKLGVSFSDVNISEQRLTAVDMPQFLRHHGLPFILLFSKNNRTLEMDQITDRTELSAKDMAKELNEMIDPETGKSSSYKRIQKDKRRKRRNVLDNRIDTLNTIDNDRHLNVIPRGNEQWLNADDLYNELTNEVEVQKDSKPIIDQPAKAPETANNPDISSTVRPKTVTTQKIQYIPWPTIKVANKRMSKKKKAQLLPSITKDTDSTDSNLLNKGCERKALRINFLDIGWGDRIIEPKKFDAHYCAGGCNFPNSYGKHLTNHATLQSLVTSIREKTDIPQPCCVPEKLQPLTVMYYDAYDNIVLKMYPDMSVESCVCR